MNFSLEEIGPIAYQDAPRTVWSFHPQAEIGEGSFVHDEARDRERGVDDRWPESVWDNVSEQDPHPRVPQCFCRFHKLLFLETENLGSDDPSQGQPTKES